MLNDRGPRGRNGRRTLEGVHLIGGSGSFLVGSAEDMNCSLVKPLCYTRLFLPSNKSPYMEGEIGRVLRTLSNLGLKRHFLKFKNKTKHFSFHLGP